MRKILEDTLQQQQTWRRRIYGLPYQWQSPLLLVNALYGCQYLRIAGIEALSHLNHDPVCKRLSIYKQLAIFMFIVGQGASNRQAQDRFQHSGETISRVFHHIMSLIIDLAPYYIKTPKPGVTHPIILESHKFTPFFDNCIGALDGVHVQAKVPEAMAPSYRNRKGTLSQNVLGVVDFLMRFTYICAGWEGSVHDSRVLSHARAMDFKIPTGSFYLGDAGYPLTHGILVPYRSVRYHLREQGLANQRCVFLFAKILCFCNSSADCLYAPGHPTRRSYLTCAIPPYAMWWRERLGLGKNGSPSYCNHWTTPLIHKEIWSLCWRWYTTLQSITPGWKMTIVLTQFLNYKQVMERRTKRRVR